MEIFNKIHSGGNTIVLVTHEEDIANHAHRIVRLRDGIIESIKKRESGYVCPSLMENFAYTLLIRFILLKFVSLNSLYMAMKIYTKTGDKGKTSLIGGTKVSKSDLRIEAYGTVDELNSYIGLCNDHLTDHTTYRMS